jgi:hypothetical protein
MLRATEGDRRLPTAVPLAYKLQRPRQCLPTTVNRPLQCTGWPIRSLIAEDRTTRGVPPRRGPKPRCSRSCSRDHPSASETG